MFIRCTTPARRHSASQLVLQEHAPASWLLTAERIGKYLLDGGSTPVIHVFVLPYHLFTASTPTTTRLDRRNRAKPDFVSDAPASPSERCSAVSQRDFFFVFICSVFFLNTFIFGVPLLSHTRSPAWAVRIMKFSTVTVMKVTKHVLLDEMRMPVSRRPKRISDGAHCMSV